MAVNTTLSGLSQTAASNGPDGTTDAPSSLDDAIRYALSFIAQLRDGVGYASGHVIQEVVYTDNGNSTSSSSLASITSTAKSITPKSSNSTLVVEVSFDGQVLAAGAGTNATGGFCLYNNTTAANVGNTSALGVSSASGSNLQTNAPCTVRASVPNTGLTAVAFLLRARYTNSATTVSGTAQVWTIREIQN